LTLFSSRSTKVVCIQVQNLLHTHPTHLCATSERGLSPQMPSIMEIDPFKPSNFFQVTIFTTQRPSSMQSTHMCTQTPLHTFPPLNCTDSEPGLGSIRPSIGPVQPSNPLDPYIKHTCDFCNLFSRNFYKYEKFILCRFLHFFYRKTAKYEIFILGENFAFPR
jgi:hypothetical protein